MQVVDLDTGVEVTERDDIETDYGTTSVIIIRPITVPLAVPDLQLPNRGNLAWPADLQGFRMRTEIRAPRGNPRGHRGNMQIVIDCTTSQD